MTSQDSTPYDKTEVNGSRPLAPIFLKKYTVLEELPLRDLISILIGDEGRRRMENRNKTNDQLFTDYYNLLLTSHFRRYLYEAKRTLNKFHGFLGEFPPAIDLG